MKMNNSLEKINVVGDRVLVKPRKESERTDSGLYLPPGVREKEKIPAQRMVKIVFIANINILKLLLKLYESVHRRTSYKTGV